MGGRGRGRVREAGRCSSKGAGAASRWRPPVLPLAQPEALSPLGTATGRPARSAQPLTLATWPPGANSVEPARAREAGRHRRGLNARCRASAPGGGPFGGRRWQLLRRLQVALAVGPCRTRAEVGGVHKVHPGHARGGDRDGCVRTRGGEGLGGAGAAGVQRPACQRGLQAGWSACDAGQASRPGTRRARAGPRCRLRPWAAPLPPRGPRRRAHSSAWRRLCRSPLRSAAPPGFPAPRSRCPGPARAAPQ